MNHSVWRRLCTPRWISVVVAVTIVMVVIFLTVGLSHDFVAIWNLPFLSLKEQIVAILYLYLNPLNHMSVVSLMVAVGASFLTGIQVMLMLYIRHYRKQRITKSVSPVGFISAVFVSLGMGCAACGTVVLLSVLSVFGAGLGLSVASVIGDVLMSVAIGMLLYSNAKMYRQAKNPLVCY